MKKRILSILLCLCMVVSLLPTAALAAGNTIIPTSNTLEDLRAAFNNAQNGDTIKLTGEITTDSGFINFITVNKAVTLDFSGNTINFKANGNNNSQKTGLFYVVNGGSLTLKNTGVDGVKLSGNYSCLVQVNAGGRLTIESGKYENTGATDAGLVTSLGGTVEIKDGTLSSKSAYTLALLSGGTTTISGGTVTAYDTYALVSQGTPVTISGGAISSSSSLVSAYIASGGSINMTGGEIKNTTSGVALILQDSAKASTLSGGKITAISNTAVISASELSIADGAVVSSDSGVGLRSDGTLTLSGGSVSSKSGVALANAGNMTVKGGTFSADSSYALLNMAPSGKSATVSGGSFTSGTGIVAVNYADGALNISGGNVTTAGGSCAVLNNAAGTVNIIGGTFSAKTATLVNNNTGAIKLSAGTIDSIVNYKAGGSVIIDGGAVKTIQGTTPKNSAGTALRQYPIQITGKKNTPIADGELTFTPAVKYNFAGVTTDANGLIYLWLPAKETSAIYKTETENALNGGLAGEGNMTVLPNFTASVELFLDNEAWTKNPKMIILSESSTSSSQNSKCPDNGGATNGVFTFSGLDENKTYYVWTPGIIESSCFGTLTKDKLSARVDYYTIALTKGEGISFVPPSNPLPKGFGMRLFANLENGYKFKHWLNTETNAVFSTSANATVDNISAPLKLTAVGELDTYTASVSIKKDNTAWAGSGKTTTLSTDKTNATTGTITGTVSGSDVTFAGLDPRVSTYYVWVDGTVTDQTVTKDAKAVALDYYTVKLTVGSNIASVTGNGNVVLKGGSASISATATAGDYVFSRWNETTGGALYSTTAETVISNITAPISLTAVGASTTYTATVTVNKDGTPWTVSPHKIVLSTTQTECGSVLGTLNNGVYTFSKLPGANTYYVWDAETVTYTGKTISAGESISKATLDYYSVTVTNNGNANITAITGGGVYLAGSAVTLSATPAQYYKVKWNDGSTASTKTVPNLSAKTDLSVTAEVDVYTGTVTVQKDDATWSAFTGAITLSTDIGNSATGKVSGVITNGVVSFENLNPLNTYYIWADNVYSGQTLLGKAAVVKYYTVSVTATGVAAIADQIVLEGKEASFTAAPTGGYDFMGWYAEGNLLSSNAAFTLTDVTKTSTLTAKASNTFDAFVTLQGASGRTITLQSGSDTAVSSFTGLDRTKTYKVLDGGIDTGFTVSKNAPNVTLQYYTVTLTKGTGISSVNGDGTYLAGSSVTIDATVSTNYAFSDWTESGTSLSTQKSYTIPAISKDYTLTANSALSFSGTVDISTGNIVIEDDSNHAGKIRITVGGTVPTDGDNLDPNTNITITGTSTGANNILISATMGVFVTLKDVNVTSNYTPALSVTSPSGTVVLDLLGKNMLKAQQGTNSIAGLNKGPTNSTLIIQSASGIGELEAYGYYGGAGIGGNFNQTAKNITINSGVIKAVGGTGAGGSAGAGIGGGTVDWYGSAENLVINGGTITAIGGNGTGGFNAMGIGVGSTSKQNLGGSIVINGGTINATGGSSNGVTSLGIGVSGGGSLTINGGTITSNSIFAGAIINGGNIDCTTTPTSAKNAKGEAVYKTTFTAGAAEGADISKTLVIRDKNGTAYGMNAVKTFAGGAVYVYLSESSAGAVYSNENYAAKVTTDGSGVFKKVTAGSAYTVSIPAPATTEGVTASGTLQQVIPSFAEGVTVTVNVSLSGTALKSGTYTVGLTGASAGTITAPATVTMKVAVGATPTDKYTFTFTMPANAVSDLAVTLSFVEQTKCTVTYSAPDATGGSVPTGGSYFEGQTYTISGNTGSLVKTGYTFAGWDKSGQQTMGTQNVTLTAQWTPSTYTVTFHNVSDTATQSFTYGVATALTANAFTKTGYTFAGWATASGAAKVYNDKDSITVAKDTDLYALWTPKTYSVTFNNGGGTGSMENQSFARDTAQELSPNTFTKTGYTFAGWKDSANTPYVNGASVTATGDITLTAQWTPISYSVKFNANGGTGSISNQSFTYDVAQGLTPNTTITRTGYTFDGWNTAQDGKGTTYGNNASVSTLTTAPNGTVTLYAVWTANTYSVKFDKNNAGATGTIADQTLAYDAAATALTKNSFTRSGYSFAGWNSAADGTGATYADQASVKNLTLSGAITLYAMWTPDVYAITFAANGGTGSMAGQVFATGNTAAISANAFTKAGYSFNGWKDDKNASVAENATVDTVGRSTSLTAQWTANTYTVAFHANGGTNSMSAQQFSYDAPATALTQNNFTRTGYKFVGWSDSPSATTPTYNDLANVSNLTPMKDGNVTLYAVWQSDTYKVSFIANGGAGLMADLSITNGESKVLSNNKFTREGYKFSGWNTRADGKGTYYPDGATVNLTPDASGIVTLYAMWTEAVRYNINGTVKNDTPAAVSGADVTLKQGSTVIASTKTNTSGNYSLTNILPGLYNLVTAKDGKTVTTLVTVAQADVTENITLPSVTTKNSVLVVDGEAGETIPNVVVGGLDTLSQTENADITMTVTAKAVDENNAQQAAIKTATGSQKPAQFLDITLKKGAADIGASNNTVLEIVQPFSFSGKTDVKVWRYHGGTVEKLTKLDTKPVAPFIDGTYFADCQNGLIYVYAKKFSTYAVSYQEVLSSSGGGSTDYSVTVNPSENGTVKTDKTTAALGTMVTVTVTPNAGYTLKSLSVTDTNGKGIAQTDNHNGTFTFTMPDSSVTVSAKFAKQSGNPFIDVAGDAYYYDAVLWAVEKGVTKGTSATTFSPNMTCTRAQTVTFLWRAMGSPEPTTTNCPFTDVAADAYYYKAVLWAIEKGITIGTSSTTFSPDATVTRGQTVTFLWRTAGKPTVTATNPFNDVSSNDYYANAVSWAVSESITTGTSAATFSPVDGCTRAQIVTFLYRYLSK